MSAEAKGVLIFGAISAVLFFLAHREYARKQGATGGTPPAKLDAPNADAITEAAFHQGPSDFAAATGPDENTDGEEVTSIQ